MPYYCYSSVYLLFLLDYRLGFKDRAWVFPINCGWPRWQPWENNALHR